MASRRASLASAAARGSPASMRPAPVLLTASGSLHEGQRFAKPGLSGFSSNSSEHTTHVLIGNAITGDFTTYCRGISSSVLRVFARPSGDVYIHRRRGDAVPGKHWNQQEFPHQS